MLFLNKLYLFDMTYYYIYKITILVGSLKNHYYIGKRKFTINENRILKYVNNINDFMYYLYDHPCIDNYTGSGKIITNFFKSHDKIFGETYNKEILCFSLSEEENCDNEIYFIGDNYLNDDNCMNLMEGGNHTIILKGKNSPCYKVKKSKEHIEKIKESLRLFYETHESPLKGVSKSNLHKIKLSESLKLYFKDHQNPFFGKHHTYESNLKNSLAHVKLWNSDTYRNNVINGMKEFYKNNESPHKGYHHTEETKKKLSKIFKGKKNPKNQGSNNGMFGKPALNRRSVLQYDKEGNLIKEYAYLNEVHNDGFCVTSVLKVCKGERKSAGGYIWKYKINNKL